MKKYLQSIEYADSVLSIAFYADTPNKNYRIYFCGSDTGARYEYLGNAEKYLLDMLHRWEQLPGTVRKNYCYKNEIPRRGYNA